MEQINAIELTDPLIYPDSAKLKKVLGDTYSVYCDLLLLFENHGLTLEWKYYKDGKAWLCKVQKKTRTIVWMSAWNGYMKATVYIPEKHTNGIYDLGISQAEKDRIRETKNVGKSKPCMFEVSNRDVLSTIERIIEYKIRNK